MPWLTNPYRFGAPSASPSELTLVPHQYWRIRASEHATNYDWQLNEIEMAATPGGADQCTGGTAIWSSHWDSANAGGYAFDNNTTTYFRANYIYNSWVGYNFGSPVTVGEVRLFTDGNRYPLNILPRIFGRWNRLAHLCRA